MIGVEQREPAWKDVPGPVRKGIGAALQLQRIQNSVMSDAADGEERAEIRQCRDAGDEERAAARDLVGPGLVLRRHAAHGIGDHAIHKRERLRRGTLVAPARQPDFEQGAVEKLPGIVAKERAPSAVGALKPGSKPDDEKPRVIGSERGYRAVEAPGMRVPVLVAEGNEPRAERAVFR